MVLTLHMFADSVAFSTAIGDLHPGRRGQISEHAHRDDSARAARGASTPEKLAWGDQRRIRDPAVHEAVPADTVQLFFRIGSDYWREILNFSDFLRHRTAGKSVKLDTETGPHC